MIGRIVELDGVARRVVGVMPRGFALPTDFTVDAAEPTQIYVPLQIDPAQDSRTETTATTRRGSCGRGATAVKATAELADVFAPT